MARIDDYYNAKTLSAEKLSGKTIQQLSIASGYEILGETSLKIPFLDRTYSCNVTDFHFTDINTSEKEVPIQEQVLILHYLTGCGYNIAGKWVSFRELPGASFYFGPFVNRAIEPLKMVFGDNPELLVKTGEMIGGKGISEGDGGVFYPVFPQVPLEIIIYKGDDEFPSEATILFDEAAGNILSPEDAAWTASLLVYRLMARSREFSS